MKRLLTTLLLVIASIWTARPSGAEVSRGDSPTLEVSTQAGEKFSLSELHGRVVLVDFWATWCEPCERSFPFYAEMSAKYGEQGFSVLAVSVDENPEAVTKYLSKKPVPFPVVVDAKHKIVELFEPTTMPTAYLVDRKGVVRFVHSGFRPKDAKKLEREISKLLAE